MASGNMGYVDLEGESVVTASHPSIIERLPIKSGIGYPSGAIVAYSETESTCVPSDLTEDGAVRYFVVAKKAAQTEEYASLIMHGGVMRDLLKKAVFSEETPETVESWQELSFSDYMKLVQSSLIV